MSIFIEYGHRDASYGYRFAASLVQFRERQEYHGRSRELRGGDWPVFFKFQISNHFIFHISYLVDFIWNDL